MKRVSIFLITVALIAGAAGCGPVQYNLTISSTEGGEVTTPGEGTFAYDEGTIVDLVAEAEEGYSFVEWTGDVGTIADVNDTTTTITMSGNYSIMANFGIEIWDWYDLDAARNNLGDTYFLTNDLDSTTPGYEELASPTANQGKGWGPIGNETDPFTGALDGQGHEIRDLFINRPDEIAIGLFAFVNEEGIIKSVGVVNASVIGYIFVGSLVGANAGTVSNSYFTGNVTGTGNGMAGSNAGGLVGINGGTVGNSSSTGSVTGEAAVGGLVGVNGGGVNGGTVSNSYSSSNVTGVDAVGGLVGVNGGGVNGGTVSNSYSSSNVTGVDDVGGLVGHNGGTVSNSYSTGSVSGNEDVGGLVGRNAYGTVSNSFWDTQTSGQATSDGGTGKNTTQMKDLDTFSGAGWDITAVADPATPNPSYIWNIPTTPPGYPFLSLQP